MDIGTSYKTLGIFPGSTIDQVKRAYKSCVKTFHPDLYSGQIEKQQYAQDRLVQINLAYETLRRYFREQETPISPINIPEQYCQVKQPPFHKETVFRFSDSRKPIKSVDPEDIKNEIHHAQIRANEQFSDKTKKLTDINTEASQYKKYIHKKYFSTGYYDITANKKTTFNKLRQLFSTKNIKKTGHTD